MDLDLDLCGFVYKNISTQKFSLKCITCSIFFDIEDWKIFIQQFEECRTDKIVMKCTVKDDSADRNFKDYNNQNEELCPTEIGYEDVLLETEVSMKEIEQCSDDSDNEIILAKTENYEGGVSDEEVSTTCELRRDSKKKRKVSISFKQKDNLTECLISTLKLHPCLWNPKHIEFKHRTRRSKALKSIKQTVIEKFQIKLSLMEIERCIQTLFDEYKLSTDIQNDPDKNSSAIVEEYINLCSYLKDVYEIEEPPCLEDGNYKLRGVLQFGKVSESSLDFVKYLQDFPVLYDPSHGDYLNKKLRKDSIKEMQNVLRSETNLRLTDDQIIRGSNNLKKWYNKTLDLKLSQGDNVLTKDQIFLLERCSFLPRKSTKEKIPCNDCGKIFFSQANLKLHMYKIHKKGDLPFKCDACDRSFPHKVALVNHHQRTHVGKTLKCEYCERFFAVRIDLQRHIAIHTGEKPFVCEQCGKTFRFKVQLRYHVTAIHSKIRAYKCTMCPKDFLKSVHLRDHIKSHLGIKDKICETCGKGFSNCHSLIRHRQIHSAVKKFVCKLCDAKFHQFVGLNAHMKRSHKVVKERVTNQQES